MSWYNIESALAGYHPQHIERDEAERAAVALVLRDGERGIELLFIERAEHPADPWSGHMAFPGGRWDAQDADLRATAMRETAEELGLDLGRAGRFLGAPDEIQALSRPRGVDLVIAPYVFRLDASPVLALSGEVRAAHWIALSQLGSEKNRTSMEQTFRGQRMSYPCLRVGDHVIWGLTYRMYCRFEEIVRSTAPRSDVAALKEGTL